jgi:hypothetical protein
MPKPSRPSSPAPWRRAVGAALGLAAAIWLAACSSPGASAGAPPAGLVALVGSGDATTLLGWDTGFAEGIPITLPKGATTWIATGRSDVLAAALTTGKLLTSDPVHLGQALAWRAVKAVVKNGAAPAGPDYFATWDPDGGRFATLAGDLVAGDAITLVVIDPTRGTATEIPIAASVVAAPPTWIDAHELVVVTGDAGSPIATIVDTATGELSDGPSGARLLATSSNARRVATMAGQGAPVVVRDTAGWLSGDGSSIASIAPPNGSTTAVAFALDPTGQRLVIAWQAADRAVSLAVHDGAQDWRRIATPKIGSAKGAVVAWRR